MKRSRIVLICSVMVVSFLSGGWLLQRGTSAGQHSIYEKARLFEDVLAHIAEFGVDSLDEAQLYEMAIEGLLGQLNDPYAAYLGPEAVADLTERTTGEYGGLGMQIDVRDGWITVIAPIAETPAAEAGIEPGDRIVEVEGESTYGWRNEKAVQELRGDPGTDVTISIARPGVPESFEITLTRATIHVRSVRTSMKLTPEIGYVSLAYSTIGNSVVEEIREAVDSLRGEGALSLILDFRNTPGGLLDQGVELTDLFLEPGELVVATRGRNPAVRGEYAARSEEAWSDMPIVVLVNGGTASAAEIFAGALQDHDRAVVLGTPTFGKGLVQTVFRLGPEQALQLTTGHWFTPSGRTIQRPMRRVGGVLRIVGGLEEELADRLGDTTVVDSSEVYYTDAGRMVIGGGGIRPDLTVRLDTLTDREQQFSRALGANIPVYRDVLTTFALDLKAQEFIDNTNFRVTSAMRSEFVRRLEEHGVGLSDSVYEGARALLDRQLGYEIARYVFGSDEEARRRMRDDTQVARALGLLEGVRTPAQLMAAVERQEDHQGN